MSKFVSNLFGGGDDTAKREAEKSRQLQQVANDRQLSEQNRSNTAVAASRRAPRGRRLFEDALGGASSVIA